MQQRQPRLGDILDDYCPRERRLTNHAVVAMVGDEIKQTRCTTCDAEHEYKHARVPRPRKKDSPAALQAQVIAGAPRRVDPPRPSEAPEAEAPETTPVPPPSSARAIEALRRQLFASADEPSAAAMGGSEALSHGESDALPRTDDDEDGEAEAGPDQPVEAEGPAHRRLIRATLPRTEGTPTATRPAPDFTIRTPTGGRAGRFRGRQPDQRSPFFNGNRSSGQQQGGQGGGQNRGGASRFGQGRGGQRQAHHGGRKGSK